MTVVALLVPLIVAALVLVIVLLRAGLSQRTIRPRAEAVVLGATTNFFDTLGIGSFAPSMAWMKFRSLVPDRLIPPTMIAGHTLPSITQACVFLLLLGVRVDPVLLVGCILACVIGGLVGVPLAARAPVRVVQAAVGGALLTAAAFYILANLNLMPAGGQATSLPPTLMLVAIAANFVFGVLINFGVGNYAPTLAMLSLFGMDPRLAFPIMASAASLCVATTSIRLVRRPGLDLRMVLGMALGGIPAVLVAAFVVRDIPVRPLRWLVVVVVLYAAVVLLRSSARPAEPRPAAAIP